MSWAPRRTSRPWKRAWPCGVVFVASVHCDTLEALKRKPPTARLLAMGAFETLVLLDGRVNPGHAVKVRTLA